MARLRRFWVKILSSSGQATVVPLALSPSLRRGIVSSEGSWRRCKAARCRMVSFMGVVKPTLRCSCL